MIREKRLVKTLRDLIRINSENPPGREKKIADFLGKEFAALGLGVRAYSFAKNRPNIVATFRGKGKRQTASAEALLLTPHYDTVPAGKGWSVDPFGGRIMNGKIFGRGATDDKCNVAASLEVVRSLVEDGFRPDKDLIVAATSDEETGSRFGIIPLLEKKMVRPKWALILDANECDAIIAQKGLIHGRIRIFGKKAHGAYNWRGVNAIEAAARIIAKLKRHRFPHRKHRLLHAPTMNIGVIHGGDKTNIVADFCEFHFDTRYLPGTDPRDVLKDIKRIVRREIRTFEIETDDIQYPYEIRRDHPLVRLYTKSAKTEGQKALLKGSEGATVISFFKKMNIPAIATGYGTHNTAHITDEFAKVDILVKGARVLEAFVKGYNGL